MTSFQSSEEKSSSLPHCDPKAGCSHPLGNRFPVDELVDATERDGHLQIQIQWASDLVPLHHLSRQWVNELKPFIVGSFCNEDFENCLKLYGILACAGSLGEYNIDGLQHITKSEGLLQIKPLWPDTYVPIENLDASLLHKAQELVIAKLGQEVWDRYISKRESTEDIVIIDLTGEDDYTSNLNLSKEKNEFKRLSSNYFWKSKPDTIQDISTIRSVARRPTVIFNTKRETSCFSCNSDFQDGREPYVLKECGCVGCCSFFLVYYY